MTVRISSFDASPQVMLKVKLASNVSYTRAGTPMVTSCSSACGVPARSAQLLVAFEPEGIDPVQVSVAVCRGLAGTLMLLVGGVEALHRPTCSRPGTRGGCRAGGVPRYRRTPQ